MLSLALFIIGEPYALTISLFERALALHNFISFLSFYTQWRGLIGSKGISPATEVMQRVHERGWTWRNRWRDLPTLTWISCTDRALNIIQIVGLVASALAFFGVYSGLNILIAAICYSSTKSVGGVFTGLQMHAHLMEIDLMYVASSPFLHVTPAAFVVLASLLNFRVMMGGGAGKWYGGDKSWRNGTAMSFHYWTQPLPNPISCYFHRMPQWMHRMESYATFVHECLCSLFVFAPLYLRIIAFAGFESLMLIINLTGNYAQIGAHTMNESLLLLNDDAWNWIFDFGSFVPGVNLLRRWLYWAHGPSFLDLSLRADDDWLSLWNLGWAVLPWACLVLPYALIQLIPLSATFHGHNPLQLLDPYSPKPMQMYNRWIKSELYHERIRPKWNKLWDRLEHAFVLARDFELFGSYVKFGHMTKFRWEIIIEGSVDGKEWKEYTFKYKPSALNKRPPFVPFHLPAYDWRLWFLPLEAARGGEPPAWFMRSLVRLLECEPTVMALFEHCPFDESNKPAFMRALLYDYRFRFGYETGEEELKQLVVAHHINDTNIVTQSDQEEEGELNESESEEEEREPLSPLEEEVVEEETAAPPQPQPEPPSAEAVVPPELKEGEGEHKDAAVEQKVVERMDEKAATASASKKRRDPAEEAVEGLKRRSSTKREPAGRPHGLAKEADESFRRAMLVKQRKLLRQLLRDQRKQAAEQRKSAKQVTHAAPPAVDEQGQRIWWVRRALVGPYGPILAVRPKPPTSHVPEAWEQALEQ